MAERRMISKRISKSAKFLRMPLSSQALYFHLNIDADDDGVVEAYPVLKLLGCTEDDLKILVAKNFVCVLNEDLVTYINDWRENNKLRADRKIDSIYKDLLLQVVPDADVLTAKKRADRATDNKDVNGTSQGQPRDGIGKDRIGKDRIGKVSKDINGSKEPKQKEEDPFETVEDEFLRTALRGYADMRKSLGKSKVLTAHAKRIFLNKLFRLTTNVQQQIEIVEEATLKNWLAPYIPSEKRSNSKIDSYSEARKAMLEVQKEFEVMNNGENGNYCPADCDF